MADTKISDLTSASALTGTEELPVVQSGATKKTTPADIKTYVGTPAPAGTGYAHVTGGAWDVPSDSLSTPQVTLSGNVSAAAWTTSGIGIKHVARTLTDTSSSGTVALQATNAMGGNTWAASGTVTYTDGASLYLDVPTASGTVTITNKWSLYTTGSVRVGGTATINPAANTNAIASTGYSLTGSNAQSLVDLAGTWNTSGTPTALKLALTNTASNASSLVADLRVGGVSRFAVWAKDTTTAGGTTFNATNARNTLRICDDGNDPVITNNGSGALHLYIKRANTDVIYLNADKRDVRFYSDINKFISIGFTSPTLNSSWYDADFTIQGHTRAVDEARRALIIQGGPQHTSATVNLNGGDVKVLGGAGASGSAGAANGGQLYLDGGQAYGTGVAGDVIVGATRGNLVVKAGAANGQACAVKQLSELTTIAASAYTDTAIQMPAGALILAVTVRVTTAVTCTSTFTVGDAGSAARFSTAAVSKAANSTDSGTAAGVYYNASAASVRITPDTTPTDATGRVRVTIFYIQITPPTS